MRRIELPLIAFLAVLAIGPPVEGQAPADGQADFMCSENLVPNPSFEDGLTGWGGIHGDADGVFIDGDEARTGKASLCLKADEPTEFVSIVSDRFEVLPLLTYRLHFFHKTESIHAGPNWRVYPGNTDGSESEGRAYWMACDGAEDWTGYYCDFVFPSDVGSVTLAFRAGHWKEDGDRRGTCWIDDIEFGLAEELEPVEGSDVSDDSIICNGGFELGHGAQPFGWVAFTWDHRNQAGFSGVPHFEGPDVKLVWDAAEKHKGERSVHIEYSGADPKRQFVCFQNVYPEEGQQYDIKFWAKAEGKGSRIVWEAYGDEGWATTVCGAGIRPGEWRQYRLRYVPNEKVPDHCSVRIFICQRGPGTVWLDELEMVPVE